MFLALLGLQALAFAPSEDILIGKEPERLHQTTPAIQRGLQQSHAWQAWTQVHGPSWQATFDERTGLVRRANGPGIPLGNLQSAQAIEVEVRQLWANHPELLGVPANQLRLGRARRVEHLNAWILRFDQVVAGDVLPPGSPAHLQPNPAQFEHFASHGQPAVWRGGVDVWIRNGKLVSFSVHTLPGAAELPAVPAISAETAVSTAISAGPLPLARHQIEGAALVVLPQDTLGEQGLVPRLTYMVRTRTGGTLPGIWVSFVDALTGELLNVHNQVRYLDGQLFAEHDTRTVDGSLSISPLTNLEVSGDTDDTTESDGSYSVSGSSVSARLTDGVWFRVDNQDGSDASVNWSGGDLTWTNDDATQAELSSYVFLEGVRLWGAEYAGDTGYATTRMRSNVNIEEYCNAYYDGNVNFFISGGGCNNSGRILDVNYHEWGHGQHYYLAETSYLDGAIGEGCSDVVAFLHTRDATIAPGFNTDGSGIRNVARDQVYPEDVVGEVHYDGLIYGGAVWDFYGLLRDELGDEEAFDVVSRIAADALRTNPTLADAYDAFLFADDDDGDLSNGTPNQCALIDAFGRHGLGPAAAGSVLGLSHEPLVNQVNGAGGYPIRANLQNLAPGCISPELGSASVVWSTDGGETWERTPLDLASEEEVEGVIPESSNGSIVQYYVEMEADGTTVTAPTGGAITPLSFAVGEWVEIWCSDFEDDDAGFSSELVSGADEEGANDWMWGEPGGLGGDPTGAFSGDNVWGNDLGGGRFNGEYQDDKHNRLSSPTIDLAGYETTLLQFQRWLHVEDALYDQARVLANGEVIWVNHDSSGGEEHHQDSQWAPTSILLPSGLSEVSLAWEIESDGGLTFGGWTIDDVCIYGFVAEAVEDSGEVDEEPNPEDNNDGVGLGGEETDDAKLSACACASSGRQPAAPLLVGAAVLGLALSRRRRS
jgi:MYXO-CTERM domain-containing protein